MSYYVLKLKRHLKVILNTYYSRFQNTFLSAFIIEIISFQKNSGFTLAGDINGITVCYKSGPVVHRAPPSVPIDQQSAINELENNLYYMNIRNGTANGATNLNGNEKSKSGDDYEFLRTSYHITPPPRFAPKTPIVLSNAGMIS